MGTAALLVAAACGPALAQSAYPTKPIRLIVPFAPGSNIDLTARQITPKLGELLGQPVVVDNKAGASGTIGATFVAKAAPDGYTILMGNAPTHSIAPGLYKNLPYDPIKDFAPIGRIATSGYVLAVSPTIPVKSVSEFITYVKAHPSQLSYASTGDGTGVQLAGAGFSHRLGVDMRHIPYNSPGQGLVDISTGEVAMIFYPYSPMAPMAQTGKLHLLATTGAKRASYLPDLPTMVEAGMSDFVELSWHGFYAPAGTPKEVIDTFYAAIAKTAADPTVIKNLLSTGVEIDLAPPAEFAEFTKGQVNRYKSAGEKSKSKD